MVPAETMRVEEGSVPPAAAEGPETLIGESEAMRCVFGVIHRVAHLDASVLITGESGTGKELVARTLHRRGPRAQKLFIGVNCTAIPEGLLESELFGHVRGAFTGATASKRGLFERADGGTLFLDEIGDMSPGLQAKLLRVLQDQEIRPVGGSEFIEVNARIIAATHRDLDEEIASGGFREDLYYRLNAIPIHLLPLRERPEDVPALVEAFVAKHAGGGRRRFSRAAIRRLQACAWRGNARELENFVERTLALTDDELIQAADLPIQGAIEIGSEDSALPLGLAEAARSGLTLREIEDRYIEQALVVTAGRKGAAARLLGIDRKTLHRRQSEARAARRDAAPGPAHPDPSEPG
jgi:two-component system response regulator HydG